MKQKTSLIIITCLISASLLLALGAVTFSWYQSRISSDKDVEIPADGFIVVGFDENPVVVNDILSPAIAMTNAVRDNRYMDVMRVYNESDETPSWIETVAETYTYTDTITFYEDPTDETISSYNFTLTAQAYVKVGEEETKIPINTARELDFLIVADVDYTDPNIADVEDLAITPEIKFNVAGSATIKVSITLWLALPDELCDPALISNNLYLEFGIVADPVTEDVQS